MTTLWFDCETYSEADLKKVGTHAYAEHPSTEITVVQWAFDDGEPVVWDCTAGQRADMTADLLAALHFDDSVTVVAHNSVFDRTLLRHCWGIDVPIERWRDTMVQAYLHALPGALGKVGDVFNLSADLAKDKRGAELIQLFCKPRPKNNKLRRATRETHPKEWAEFLEYSYQDIVSMRAIAGKMPCWNYKPGGPEELLWRLDQKINDRGFLIDTELAAAAVEIAKLERARIKQETIELTDGDVTSVSQRDALLTHILLEHGVVLPDMRADTLRRRMEDPELPDGVKLLIALRLEATKTSTAKYQAALNAVSSDGRLRNTMQFAGANRTGRWAHRLFQPGNMPRPSRGFNGELQEDTIKAVKNGGITLLPDAMTSLSDCVRGSIIAPPGKKLVIADLSNIEGRMLAWLAGEEWKLKAFADFDQGIGEDLYKVAYGRAFNVDPATATGQKRQIGKVQELALGYEGGVGAFLTFASVYQMDLGVLADAVHTTAPKDKIARGYSMLEWTKKKKRSTFGLEDNVYVACEVLKQAWRDAHPATVALWKEASESVKQAIANPGEAFPIGPHCKARVDGAWLRIRLPSGRVLCYLNPKVDDKGQSTYSGVSPYTRQWCRIKTYSGKFVENITQAAARDVLAANMPAIEGHNYEILLSVHDELITETPDTDEYSSDELASLMSTNPPWAEGLPLAAAGFECYRYRKD